MFIRLRVSKLQEALHASETGDVERPRRCTDHHDHTSLDSPEIHPWVKFLPLHTQKATFATTRHALRQHQAQDLPQCRNDVRPAVVLIYDLLQ